MVTPPDTLGADDLPLLGEPLPIELANSLCVSNGTSTDFLATARLVRLWSAHVQSEPPILPPRSLDEHDVSAVRDLRDAVRELLNALANSRRAPTRAIHKINHYAAAAATRVELTQNHAGNICVKTRYSAPSGIDALLGRLAIETIVLAAGLLPTQLRRCEGPGCAMLFVRIHHRRQWCHPSCGHRARQASYYRRKLSANHPSAADHEHSAS